MTRRFIVRPLAEADLADALSWYEADHHSLAKRFLTETNHAFARIRERPLQFPTVHRGVRRALLNTFPYGVYFQDTGDTLIVLAVLHLKRNPKTWRGRV